MPARDIKKCVLLVSEWVASGCGNSPRPPAEPREEREKRRPQLCVVAGELLNPTLDAKYEKKLKSFFFVMKF
jgi:hypothetical protein